MSLFPSSHCHGLLCPCRFATIPCKLFCQSFFDLCPSCFALHVRHRFLQVVLFMVPLWNPIAIEALTSPGHGGSADYKGALRLFIKPRDERRDVHACNDHEQSACCDNSLLAPYMFHSVPAQIVFVQSPSSRNLQPWAKKGELRGKQRRLQSNQRAPMRCWKKI
jgi:hypothetical protein